MSKKYGVSIVGCGSIGALKPDDIDYAGGSNILTHAHEVYMNDHFYISSLIDKHKVKATNAGMKWDCLCSNDYAVLAHSRPDIVVIATPTRHHLESLINVFDHWKPEIIVMEKPCGENAAQCFEIMKLCVVKGVKLFVNYNRAYNPYFMGLKTTLRQEKVLSCTLTYNRGLIREASHFIQLCNMWFGKHQESYNISERFGMPSFADFSPEDTTDCVVMKYENCPQIFMIPIDGNECGLFEIDILTDAHRYMIVDNGNQIVTFPVDSTGTYGHYPTVKWNSRAKADTHLSSMGLRFLYRSILDSFISPNLHILCGGQDALAIHQIYEKEETCLH